MTDKDILTQVEKMNLVTTAKLLKRDGFKSSEAITIMKQQVISQVKYMFGVNEQYVLMPCEQDVLRYNAFLHNNIDKLNLLVLQSFTKTVLK